MSQLAGLPLLPLMSGGVGTLSMPRGSGGGVDAVFLATGADRQLLTVLPELVVNTDVLGAELSQRSVDHNSLELCLPQERRTVARECEKGCAPSNPIMMMLLCFQAIAFRADDKGLQTLRQGEWTHVGWWPRLNTAC